MFEIHKRPSRDLRNHYLEVAEIVKARNDVMITNKGQVDFVLINPDDYEEFKAFKHRQYVAAALKEVEDRREEPGYWLSEAAFFEDADDEV